MSQSILVKSDEEKEERRASIDRSHHKRNAYVMPFAWAVG
jgi:hypothetical protein